MISVGLVDDLGEARARRAAPAWLTAAAAAALLCAAGAPLLPLAGAGPDEAVHARLAAEILELGGLPAGWPWLPWMKDSYQGALKTYALLLPMKLLGADLLVVRGCTLAFGAAAAFFLALLCARRYGRFLGALAALALALDPALVLGSAFDTAPAALGMALKAAGLWLLAAWWEEPQDRLRPFAAGACFGLAVWDKSNFLWFLLAAPAAMLLAPRKRLLAAWRGGAAAAALGLLAGSLPFVCFNLKHPLLTFLHPMHGGWGLGEHAAGLSRWIPERWAAMAAGLSGQGIYGLVASQAQVRAFPALGGLRATSAAVAALAALVGRRAGLGALREPAAWLGMAAVVYAVAVLSPLPVKYHHFYVIHPFPLLALAALARRAWALWPAPAPRLALALPFIAVWGFHLATLRAFRSELTASGGSGQFYRGLAGAAVWLARYRGEHPDARVHAADGLGNSLALHLRGRVPSADGGGERLEPGGLLLARAEGFGFNAKGAARARPGASPVAVFPYSDGRPWVAALRDAQRRPALVSLEVEPRLELLAAAWTLCEPEAFRARWGGAPPRYARGLRDALAARAELGALCRALEPPAARYALVGALLRGDAAERHSEPVRPALAALARLSPQAWPGGRAERERLALAARREAEAGPAPDSLAAYLRVVSPPRVRFLLSPLLPASMSFGAVEGLPGGGARVLSALASDRGGLRFQLDAFGNGLAHEWGHALLDPLFRPYAGRFAGLEGLRPERCTSSWDGCVQEHLVLAATLRALAQERGEAALREQAAGFARDFPFLPEALEAFRRFELRPDLYPEVGDAAGEIAQAFLEGLRRRAGRH